MMVVRRRSIILCLTGLLVVILVLNTYFIYMVVKENSSRAGPQQQERAAGQQDGGEESGGGGGGPVFVSRTKVVEGGGPPPVSGGVVKRKRRSKGGSVVAQEEEEEVEKAGGGGGVGKTPKRSASAPHGEPKAPRKKSPSQKQVTGAKSQSPKTRQASNEAAENILHKLKLLNASYYALRNEYKEVLSDLMDDLKVIQPLGRNLWRVATKWITTRQIVPQKARELGSVMKFASTARILQVESSPRGTQLKLQVTLDGGQKALFKPKWYSREEVIRGPVYAGKDRHNAEVAAFQLSRILGLQSTPVVTGRKLYLSQEVISVASPELLATFFQEGNNTCLYGVCYYCKAEEPVCANKDELEGALVLFLPPSVKLKKYRSPWQRTYKDGILARWETDPNYCTYLQRTRLYYPESSPRLLDLVSTAVFDFLLDNGDRHHYEVMANTSNSIVVLLDNGKGFGTPYEDHLDILAPLYQCCMIRRSLWDRLLIMTGGALSQSLKALLEHDPISPVLTSDHLQAVDRRLLKVVATVQLCLDSRGAAYVLRDDGYR